MSQKSMPLKPPYSFRTVIYLSRLLQFYFACLRSKGSLKCGFLTSIHTSVKLKSMKILILLYLFGLPFCYAETVREIEIKKRAENEIKKKEEYEKKKIVREKMSKEAKLKWEQEENRIRSMYSNDLNKSKISRLSVTERLILGIKTGLSVYKISWNIGGKKGVLDYIEKQKAKNANAGTYNYSFGRMNGDEGCHSLLEINTRSGLSSDETNTLASKFPCELSDDKIKVYAFARFKENNKLDIWSMDENGLFEHIQDGFDPGLTK